MLPTTFGSPCRDPLQLLCLGAHCDDIEIGCGGSVLRLLAERPGSSVHWVVFASNKEREAEARAAANEVLAAAAQRTIAIETFRESYFPYVGAQIKDYFESLKAAVKPDLIFTHHHRDMHQDHRVVSELTWNTFRNHIVLEYEIPKYEGDLGTPNLFVPLTRETADRKVALVQEHFRSQATRTWFKPDTFHGLMSIRGIECGAPEGRAEAFHVRKLVL
jgi:LmbE family N-acetylglucosaminyl deacetylase